MASWPRGNFGRTEWYEPCIMAVEEAPDFLPLCRSHQHEFSVWKREAENRERQERQGKNWSCWCDSESSVVYYVQDADGQIKIGTTTQFEGRLKVLRRDFGVTKVLARHCGDMDREKLLHFAFRHWRITPRGEWFRRGKPLLAHIEMVNAYQADSPAHWTKPGELIEHATDVKFMYRQQAVAA